MPGRLRSAIANTSRMFFERAGTTSTGGSIGMVGEGFWKGRASRLVDLRIGLADGGCQRRCVRVVEPSGGTAVCTCVLTGGTSGRVARASVQASPNANAIVRGMIAGPAIVGPGGSVAVLVQRSTPSNVHNVYLDGVLRHDND